MSIEQNKEYYDSIYEVSEEYSKEYSESVYLEMWNELIKIIPKGANLFDLGCGPGQFGHFLSKNGYDKYTGYDFSAVAINKANELEIPDYQFIVKDLNGSDFRETEATFLCLETFEHIQDYRLINNLGLGKEVIFTVPDFNDPAHIRYFHDVNSVVERYKNVIKFSHAQKFQRWYLCRGITI